MIRIDDHTNINLDTLAEEHYDNRIKPLNADGINYHSAASLIGRIKAQRAADAAIPNQTRVDFWNFLLDNNCTKLKKIIISRPNVLKVIISEIEGVCGVDYFSVDNSYNGATYTEFGKIVKNVFNYDSYRSGTECSIIYNQFNLSFCPYCNEQIVQVVEDVNSLTGEIKKKALLQLDHFYPQSRHPYFAVSFFNMIPGCSVCNAQLKGEKKFDIDSHFNPFDKRLDDYFRFELDSFLLLSPDDVLISFKNILPYADNALADFNILNRYKNLAHKTAVFCLFQYFKYHSKKINRSTAQQFKGLFTTESKRQVLIRNYNIPINQNQINHVHLGKLKRDILIQMGILTA